MSLPLPLLTTRSLNALVYPSELECESRPNLLQTRSNLLNAFHGLPVSALDALFRPFLIPEHVPMPSKEYVVALIV